MAQLTDAIVRELREAELFLEARAGTFVLPARQTRRYPYALLAAALVLVARFGVRSEEFNNLDISDVEVDPHGNHTLHLRAPNKAHRSLPIDNELLAVLEIIKPWLDAAREADPAGAGSALFVYPSTNGRTARYVTTRSLARHLDAFCVKWHQRYTTDANGAVRPVLHAPGDPSKPLHVSYRKLRAAFTVYSLIRRGGDLSALKEILGHERISTTRDIYAVLHEDDYQNEIALATEMEGRLLCAGLKHPTVLGLAAERLEGMKDASRETPHGKCRADTCRRLAGDCIGCAALVVLTSRRSNIEGRRDWHLEQARKAFKLGDRRIAENQFRKAARASWYLDMIDEKLAREGK